MRNIFFYTFTLLLFNSSYAQQNIHSLTRGEVYKVSINVKDKGFKDKGYLANITDSSMHMSNVECPFGSAVAGKIYNYYDVENFSIHRKGNNLTRILWGAGIGMITGLLSPAVIGDRTGENPNSFRVSAGVGALVGLVGGTVAGVYDTTIRHQVPIRRQKATFQSVYADLTKEYTTAVDVYDHEK